MKHEHKALVIDDQQGVLETVKAILFSMEHGFDTARTQREALELLDSRPYCYVLLDLEFPADEGAMPRIRTGFNCLESIRRRFRREDLPVIIMTAHENGTEYPIRALQLGANDFAKKPFDDDLEPLEVKVQRVLAGGCAGRGSHSAAEVTPPAGRAAGREREAEEDLPGPRLHFHGECRKRRYRMEIDGKVVYVRLGTFTILWKLAAAAMSGGSGWVAGRELNAGNYHNAISRLRQDLLAVAGAGDSGWVEGDGHGMFRLGVPRGQVSFDEEAMHVHHAALLGDLPRTRLAAAG
ncbi:MAG: response regulator [Planctomycetes bacterium]|nr:response regulator [Planctomycetota bacterium]